MLDALPPTLVKLLKLGLFFYVGLYLVSIAFLNRIVFLPYIPGRALLADPARLGLPFRDETFRTADGLALNGWFVPADTAEATVLFFHGNAGNISHRLGTVEQVHALGFNLFIFDYRGYGRSEGTPDEAGLYEDARAAWDHLTGPLAVATGSIALVGHSLGGAAAADLSTAVDAPFLGLESSFASLPSIGSKLFPYRLFGPLIPNKFDSFSKLPRSRAKTVTVAHSTDDPVIPFSEGERLASAAPDRIRFFPLTGAGHDERYPAPDYYRELAALIRAATGKPR